LTVDRLLTGGGLRHSLGWVDVDGPLVGREGGGGGAGRGRGGGGLWWLMGGGRHGGWKEDAASCTCVARLRQCSSAAGGGWWSVLEPFWKELITSWCVVRPGQAWPWLSMTCYEEPERRAHRLCTCACGSATLWVLSTAAPRGPSVCSPPAGCRMGTGELHFGGSIGRAMVWGASADGCSCAAAVEASHTWP
jgi:hypothetical protein